MLRSRVRLAYAGAPMSSLRVCSAGAMVTGAGCRPCNSLGCSALAEQRRASFKYAKKSQMTEMRQPAYIHDKRYGIFSDHHNVGKSRRGLPYITPLYTKHMNLWETDTDASTNRFFRSYVFGQRELHQLLGRPHGFEANEAGGKQADSAYELATDQRYKGITRPAITNLHYEPEWNYTLYRNGAHGSQLSNPRSPFTEEVLGPELVAIRDIKSVEHCKAWFDRLQHLIKLHYDAVGDIGEFKSRHTQHVHEFFVMFHDAVSHFNFQDGYLLDQFKRVRPAELEDIFGIFLEMEGNYINEDYCPRCSLPTATTRYCGEGDTNTPFRKHRGRWAPHQRWGKEWFDVVVRRAEALWYRSTEDPYFGTLEHTQRQVEGMLTVYIKAKQRAKAIDFVNAIRGSKEFLLGRVSITAEMQHALDHLLDTTPHQHLLTNSFSVHSKAAVYTGEASQAPLSPLQLRIDLEKHKYRRQQKEEGVVRVPPALWKLDTSAIVPYKLDANKRVTNWREVKAGIEASFMSSGLPKEAYTSEEWREMLYWKHHIAARTQRRAQLEAEKLTDEAKARSSGKAFVVFPDKDWYRVFEATPEALKPFNVSGGPGMVFTASARVFPNPAEVHVKEPVSGADLRLDTTAEACKVYGDYEMGDVVRLTSKAAASTSVPKEVIILGVNKAGAEADWTLMAAPRPSGDPQPQPLVELGKDCMDIMDRFDAVENTGRKAALPPLLEAEKRAKEEFLGQIVGVRGGQLYVQWRLLKGGGSSTLDRSVAVCVGSNEVFASQYVCRELSVEALVEPSSWRTPFRNEFAEERLRELEQAPFSREQWASLIKGKYTPKPKKFGYTQHTTQDDFETKEYKDRVLARQFFNDPQAFEVLPERKERAVRFEGKWAYQRTHGLPTVDRNELENGWGEVEPVTDMEMEVIEQALRDISGRRPGNFVKSPTETQSLRLNESWWTPLEFGWEEHNRQQKAFLDSTEQHLTESARLPFQGKVPPFGTSYGIGERVRDIAADYAKGFGLGPHGHSPGHDTAAFNTLGAENARVRTLGLSNPLVRLFNEKLGAADPAAWALEQCGRDEANVKQLLLSLHEWRERGRAPSLLLTTVLGRYLEKEVALFNEGLPPGVPRLSLAAEDRYHHHGAAQLRAGEDGEVAATASSNIWSEVDPMQYGYEYVQSRDRGDDSEAYILSLIQRANLGGNQANFSDVNYVNFLQQDVLARFQLELARIVGRGIPANVIAQRSIEAAKSNPRAGGTVVQYVKVSELANLLRRMKVSSENVSVVERGLVNSPEHIRLPGTDDVIVPTSLLFAWSGPTTSGGPTSAGAAADSQSGRRHSENLSRSVNAAATTSTSSANRSTSSGGGGDKMVLQILEDLALRNDGSATDVRYAIRENKRNAVLRREFFNAFLPVCGKGHAQVAELYELYCDGSYVPNITVAIEVFTHFLANLSTKPETIPSVVEYFAVNTTGRHPGQYTQLELLPPTVGPFQFDCTKVETIETVELFRKYGIVAGPVRVVPTHFLPAKSQSMSYFTQQRQGDTVRVTTNSDQGLRQTLEKSAQWGAISSNPKLQFILKSQGALVASFNRYFQRVTPMLNMYMGILSEYNATMQSLKFSAQNANHGLARVLENEAAPNIEQDFRRNAERYWRGVLENRNRDDAATGGSGGGMGSPPQGFASQHQQQQQQQQQQRQQQQRSGRGSGTSGSVDLGRALGVNPRQQRTGSAAGGTRSGNSGGRPAGSAAATSMADRLGSVLGVVSKDGVAKKPTGGAKPGSSSSNKPN